MNRQKVYVHRLADWYPLYMNDENEKFLNSFANVVSEGSREEPLTPNELVKRIEGASVILSLNGIGASEITQEVLKTVSTVKLIVISHARADVIRYRR